MKSEARCVFCGLVFAWLSSAAVDSPPRVIAPLTPLDYSRSNNVVIIKAQRHVQALVAAWPRGTYFPYRLNFLRNERFRLNAPSTGCPVSTACLRPIPHASVSRCTGTHGGVTTWVSRDADASMARSPMLCYGANAKGSPDDGLPKHLMASARSLDSALTSEVTLPCLPALPVRPTCTR